MINGVALFVNNQVYDLVALFYFYLKLISLNYP